MNVAPTGKMIANNMWAIVQQYLSAMARLEMIVMRRSVVALFTMLFASIVVAAEKSSINMPVGVTEVSRQSYDLHMLVIYVCCAIAVVVFGALFWSLIRYRRSVHPNPDVKFTHSNLLEFIWTAIPIAILVALVAPFISALETRYDTSRADVDIKVTGLQWKWQYDYLKEDVSFISNLSTTRDAIEERAQKSANYLLEVDNELVVPVNKKIRLLVTAGDVIHSWWVPDLGVKQDAIPGYINDTWFEVNETGVYRGQCSELCGKDHGFMPIVVRAVSQNEYTNWVAERREAAKMKANQAKQLASKSWTKAELMTAGAPLYQKNCLACHQPQGQGIPPSFPSLVANPLVINADASAVIDTVVNGRKGTAMAAYGQQLSKAEMAAVITYIRNSFGNSASVVLPKDIK